MTKKREPFTVTRAEFARLLATTPDRMTKYVAEGMPVRKTGGGRGKPTTFDLAKCLPWLLKRRAGTSLDEERTRYFRLSADKVEQEVRRRAGELVDAAEVERRWAGMIVAVRERLLALPSTALQRRLVHAEGEEALITLVNDALVELSARGEDVSRGDAAA